MTLLPLLLTAHFIGDWVVQTDWQAANKMSSWRANQMHMIGYHICVWVALAAAGMIVRPLPFATIFCVSWATHAFIDRRWPVKWLMRHTGSAPFSETTFGVIAVDQALHLSILCVLAAIFAR